MCLYRERQGFSCTEARMLGATKALKEDDLLVRTEQGRILWWRQSV